MKHECISRMGVALSVTALFVLPFVSFADEFPAPAAANFNVILTANSFKNAVAVGPGTAEQSAPVTLGWSATGAKSCIGSWFAEPLSSVTGTVTGTIPLKVGTTPVASRTFTVVCFGVGTAKSAKVVVTLAKADLSISKLTISGLTPVVIPNSQNAQIKKNTYKAGNPAYKLLTSLKNGGKFKADSVVVSYQYSTTPQTSSTWVTLTGGEKTESTIAAGATKPLDIVSFPAVADQKGYHFRACADLANTIVESNESNNCSKSIGPFIFE